MKYNIYDVAKKSGVSIVTVSKVINNSGTVREKNRQKVLQAMKELNYNPSAAARSLASGKTRVIGLVIDSLTDTFLSSALSAINQCLEKHGYFLALSLVEEADDKDNIKVPYLFQEDRVDGLLIVSPVYEDMYILELKGKKIPFVLMDNQKLHHSIPSIVVNNYKGGYDATRHLIELGHKNILHISGPDLYMSSRERIKGYIDAMSEAGYRTHIINSSEFSIASGYEITQRLLSDGLLNCTGIFAADDYIAFGVIDALRNADIKVPGDISVIGYDDQELASSFHPGLTTIKQPAEEMGLIGAETLIKIIRGELKRFNTVALDPTLVVRESTAAPKSK